MKWPRWITFILGVWLAAAPFALGYTGKPAVANGLVVGLAIAIFSISYGRVEGTPTANWLNWGIMLLGIWVLLAPFLLGYHNVGVAGTRDMIVGFAVIFLAWLQGATTEYKSRPHRDTVNKGNNGTLAGGTVLFSDWTSKDARKSSKKRLSEDKNSLARFWGHFKARLFVEEPDRHRAPAEMDPCPCRQKGGERK